ncbi:MAG: AAA family ATPase [Caldithrix sp.]|nr:AAA family ATPase [Caldithrix sp.]
MAFNFSELNDVQQKAVKTTEGPVLILAGAGSGKTRTLTYRIAYLIDEKKVKPSNILAVTFTNKAANEMKERVEKLIEANIQPLWIGTFHSVCARILRREADALGYERNFSIYDVDDQTQALKKVMSSLNISRQLYTPKMLQNRLSRMKNKYLYPQNYLEAEGDEEMREILPDIYNYYQRVLKESNALDFDDLLIKPIELFNRKPEILKKYADKFKYVLIDEYQDINHAQYLFVKKLAEEHKNICVVGDEDQSIYGWRGADITNILNFNQDFPDAEIFKLEENYRSHNNILQAANSVVKNNEDRMGKQLWTQLEAGSKIIVYENDDEMSEAKKVVETIHDEMYTKKRSFNDIAILYRTNVQSRVIEDELRRNAITYNVVGGIKFYDRKEIKDLLAYLRVIVNPADTVSLKRIVNFPLRGIGETTVNRIEKFAEEDEISLFDAMGRVDEIQKISAAMGNRVIEFYNLITQFIKLKDKLDPTELASSLASEAGLINHYKTEYDQYEAESRVANIQELINSIGEFIERADETNIEANLASFLEEVSLLTDVDQWNDRANAVTLMTLHAAKGLEFPVVYITGLEMGLIPLQRNSADLKELEEERRLLYVGMTRAEQNLYLSYTNRRRRQGAFKHTTPSLFLDEIPVEYLDVRSKDTSQYKPRKNRKNARRKKIEDYFENGSSQDDADQMYKVGQPVYHETFGKGEIINLEGNGDKMKITVHFEDEDLVKKLIKKYANLSPVES